MNVGRSPLTFALMVAGAVLQHDAQAVRINPDGQGQALIYPYYTARSTSNNHPFVTAFSVTNTSSRPKALKVRVLEGRGGATVLDFNLFLGAHDVWTGGILGAGAGAGIFTSDRSCTMGIVSTNPTNPTRFRNGAYQGDRLGDSLDRTYEGYLEVLEMGTIDPSSALGQSVTVPADYTTPNMSRPSCAALPVSDIVPAGLSRPTGGLTGTVSYFNVSEGTAYTVDAVALGQWSSTVQWSSGGNEYPSLADANPAASYIVDARANGDVAYISTWSKGRDAVSALLMVDRVRNDYSVEASIKAATDWVLSMPTKRFYVSGDRHDPPFAAPGNPPVYSCERRTSYNYCERGYFDREGQLPGCIIFFDTLKAARSDFCGATSMLTFSGNYGSAIISHVFQSTITENVALGSTWQNGWMNYLAGSGAAASLTPGTGATTVVDLATGQVTAGATVTYFGLPIVGFGVQSFANGSLPGPNGLVLSNYGGQSNHKFTRRIELAP